MPKSLEFFVCKLCGKPFKQLRHWKTGWQLTFACPYTPIFANHLRNQHPTIYQSYEAKFKGNFPPQGKILEQLEKENSQPIKGTEQEFKEKLLRIEGSNHA